MATPLDDTGGVRSELDGLLNRGKLSSFVRRLNGIEANQKDACPLCRTIQVPFTRYF